MGIPFPVKILVTGITGYIGALVAARMVRDGHEVLGFARNPERVNQGLPVVKPGSRPVAT